LETSMDTKQTIEDFCDRCPYCSDCDWAKEISAKDRCDFVKRHLGWEEAVRVGAVR